MTGKKLGILYGRYPTPGCVKTRLADSIGVNAAYTLYKAMLADMALQLRLLDNVKCVAGLAGCDMDTDLPEDPLARGAFMEFELWPQPQTLFGKRLEYLFERAFARQFEKVVLVGSDCPEVSIEDLKVCFELLDTKDVVVGPACDGGYNLIAMRDFFPELFLDIAWSTSAVLSQTVNQARRLNLSVGFLECRADVDYLEDLIALAERLDQGISDPSTCQATYAWLEGKLPETGRNIPFLEWLGVRE